MAGVRIKFRCYQCNQLLSVSQSKVGSVVACPKCSTDLIVPEPDESPAPPAPAGEPPPHGATAAFLSALAAGLPVDIADIRPEDIRAESDVAWSPPTLVPEPEPEPAPPPPPEVAAAAAPAPVTMPIPVPAPSPVESIVPAIKVEPPSLSPERAPAVRSRDLVLPRSVVASWSLFVLLAQGLAFLAGLLAGHFIWRIH